MEGGRCELARRRACEALPRQPSVPCLISVLLDSGQGRGPSAEAGAEKAFLLCRKLASEASRVLGTGRACEGRPEAGRWAGLRGGDMPPPRPPPRGPRPQTPEDTASLFLKFRGLCLGVASPPPFNNFTELGFMFPFKVYSSMAFSIQHYSLLKNT